MTKPTDLCCRLCTGGQVLKTLSPQDRVSVVGFASGLRLPDGCQGTQLSMATPANIDTLIAFVNSFQPDSGTSYGIALQAAFSVLREPAPTPNTKRVILFLTDGEPNDNRESIFSIVNTANSAHTTRIFTFGMGISSSSVGAPCKRCSTFNKSAVTMCALPCCDWLVDMPPPSSPAVTTTPFQILGDIASQNNGTFTGVPDGGDLRSVLGSYYTSLSQPSETAMWTTPYVDSSGLGVVSG